MSDYQFTNAWFDQGSKSAWEQLLPQIKPAKILEIGSYEGASTCYLIDTLASSHALEIHCIDTWEGGVEHQPDGGAATDMQAVEARFRHNLQIAIGRAKQGVDLVTHKKSSDICLAELLGSGRRNYFDFIYVDGSHLAPDVLCDAVLAFKLLRIGGFMVFDDYLWSEELPYGRDPLRCPKPAIDAFVNLNIRKLKVLQAPLYQLYIKKVAD